MDNPVSNQQSTQNLGESTLPQASSSSIPPSKPAKSSMFLIVAIIVAIVIVIGATAGVYFYQKSASKNVSDRNTNAITSAQQSEVQLETKYDNPFEEKTQYSNPFEETQNPFDSLAGE